MKNDYLFTLFICLISGITFAQKENDKTGIVSGKIIDQKENSSLPGATILLDNGKRYTISDQNGHYEFLNIPEGIYTIKVDYLGYQSEEKQVEAKSKQNVEITFYLTTDSEDLEAIVIVGESLKGQAKALNQQKNNTNITNVISSDQVGRFPDSNIGDALKRVSGITMQNDQGEARDIIIRGIAPSLNSVTINGDRIPSAEGENRNVQMDLIPSDMISTIEVNKTLTSDMDADAIGGSVNLITRASPNAERISATLAGGYGPIREKGNYTGALVYGNRYLDSKFGMVLSASYNNNNFGSDNIEATWEKDKFNNVFVRQYDIRKYDIQRKRRSFSGAFDYKFNQNHRIHFNAIYNWRDDRENRYRARYRNIKPQYDSENENVIIGYKGEIRRQTKGGIDNNRNKNTRLETQKVQNYSLGGEHLFGSALDMNWSMNYSSASEDRPNERYIDFSNKGVDMTEDLSDTKKPYIIADSDLPESLKLRKITENHNYTEETVFGTKINFKTPLSVIEDKKGRLRFGGRVRIKDKKRDNIFYEYSPINENKIELLSEIPNVYYSGKNYQAGSKYIPGYFAEKNFLGRLDLENTDLFNKKPKPDEYLAKNYKAKEQILAAYIRWDQDLNDQLSMIVGTRVEYTSIDYTGNYVMNEKDLIGEIKNKNNYTNVLPNLTFKYKSFDDWVLRTAFTTALARPNYYALAPYVNVINEDSHIRTGNPNLKATYSYNFDFMAEKYFKSVGIFSGGLFYKNLKNFIYTYSNKQYSQEEFQKDFPNEINPIPDGELWDFRQKRNGETVNLYGFEVSLQRQFDFIPGAFWKGLGLYVNYTYTHSEAKGITNEDGETRTSINLPGTAPHMFNGSLAWENKRFSARISLNYTSDYIDELGGNEFGDVYYDKQMFLDANASYKITDNFRIFAEANNLTNQPLRYYQGISSQTMQVEYYQPKFNLGIKFDL